MSDQQQYQYQQGRQVAHHDQPRSYQVVKAATAVTAAGSLLVLSALILAGTVILLTVATLPLVIFSPVLVPAVITAGLIMTGFLSSGGFGVAAITVLSWIYRYMTGKHTGRGGPAGPGEDEACREDEGDEGQGGAVRAAALVWSAATPVFLGGLCMPRTLKASSSRESQGRRVLSAFGS
ncbi:hypothetical protein MLD38_008922 [Melastoma candidum]|uniref:Uncharacterized protein n=1 Tax=Melastoma candidum TaxID=119954 RepID=A0ACB9RV26_9MYRT|nr:hypothetical protein MLD38_008922 [Melastoma candidum]